MVYKINTVQDKHYTFLYIKRDKVMPKLPMEMIIIKRHVIVREKVTTSQSKIASNPQNRILTR